MQSPLSRSAQSSRGDKMYTNYPSKEEGMTAVETVPTIMIAKCRVRKRLRCLGSSRRLSS